MKNVILTCIASLVVVAQLSAQQTGRPVITDNLQSMQMNALPVSKIHVKAMRDFLKRDKPAANAEWMIVENGFVVKYTDKNNSHCRSVYNSRGQFSYTIKQYYESNMPRDVRGMVKSQYYDFTITLVEEIITPLRPLVYVVHLEDANTLKNIRISDREMEVKDEYKRNWPK
ncbi:hypothetical protein A3860_01720 [Niastella vici]|uniref:Beta-lactamase-inhibitor-like PepSY-like domain-containing protein n=1 Tax=Niastella vici TaxID=1703345 RepID=A0A1V9G904_9BACT|nr:hypothetical protein [Niastella vici]OQP67103.1 hypothetical protein A3860_01720 [Niastella vici]